MYTTTDFRRGLKIELDNEVYQIVEFQHVKPGKGGAFVRTRLKSLETGLVLDKTFRSGEKVGKPDLVERHVQYLYRDEVGYNFMDLDNYEQIFISQEQIGDDQRYLKESLEVDLLMHEGRPLNIEFPTFVELEVTQTEPGVRGDTASGGSKPATTETGLVVNVPFFVDEGDVLKIDTRSGEYVEKVNR